jgi:hypothetical protein
MSRSPSSAGLRLPDEAVATGDGAARESTRRVARLSRRGPLGGTEGNEILTSVVGAVLTLLLAAEGITLLRMGSLLSEHMFIGVALIGPAALKIASTGYRFARYYTGAPPYREKGPPLLPLRLIAPVLVVATVAILVTGVWLLLLGHRSDTVLLAHKVAFFAWAAVFVVHFLSYVPRMARSLRADWTAERRRAVPGSRLRAAAVAVALGGGVAVAIAVLPLITGWHGGHRS